MPVLTAGKSAPPFELTGTDGKPYSLQASLTRGPVVAAFFKVGCPTCQYAFPFLERLYQQLRAQGAQIWGIAQDEAEPARRFAKEYSITFPILIDEHSYKTSRAYALEYVPSIFLIDSGGRAVISSEGFNKNDFLQIQKSLAQTLAATPGPLFLPTEKIPEYKPG